MKLLVEATSHPFWESGLNPQKTLSRHPIEYPGKTQLGILLIELRAKTAGNERISHQTSNVVDSQTHDIKSSECT